MASGHVSRANRPNTWPHRPMLLRRKKSLPTRSRPHMTQGGHAVRVLEGNADSRKLQPFITDRRCDVDRHSLGEWPVTFLKARLKAASES